MSDPITTRDEALAEQERLIAKHAGEHIAWEPMSVQPFLPRVLPVQWSQIGGASSVHPHFYARGDSKTRLLVALSAMRHESGAEWFHLSASYVDRCPSWATMCELKDLFIGVNRVAIQVHPRKEAHANLHPYCLHLWSRLDADAAPDFRVMGMV